MKNERRQTKDKETKTRKNAAINPTPNKKKWVPEINMWEGKNIKIYLVWFKKKTGVSPVKIEPTTGYLIIALQ